MKPFITPEISLEGKKLLPYQCEGVDPIKVGQLLLGQDLCGFASPVGQTFSASWAFYLFLGETKMLFSSACTQISGWQEVGSLNISLENELKSPLLELNRIDISASQIIRVERMVYEDDDVVSFCGLIVTTKSDVEIVIAAGIPPGSVSIQSSLLKSKFEPQFAHSICRIESIAEQIAE